MKKVLFLSAIAIVFFFSSCEPPAPPDDGEKPGNNGTVDRESPDFVTFANGKFPKTWVTYTWEVDDVVGYDDNYSLRCANYPVALVYAFKTVDTTAFVEFYTKGGDVNLYIDSEKATAVSFIAAENGWTKWLYTFEKGRHEFKWEAEGIRKYIDAVKFTVVK